MGAHFSQLPELILEDIALFFADIYVQWREVSWWVCRIHHTFATSALPILSAPNYVVVTERDYEAFGHRPFGLVELVLGRNSHVFATCLPRWMNWPIVRAFLEPITHSGHFDIQMRGLYSMGRVWIGDWCGAMMASSFKFSSLPPPLC